jgi:hypothetical protein
MTLILVLVLFAGGVFADTRQEIDHLLDFVAKTNCKYDRNGTIHNGPEARDHINMKYEYYRDKVKTAEDFIKYSATKSKLSGKKYKIHCPNSRVMDSSDWLLNELKQFRESGEG